MPHIALLEFLMPGFTPFMEHRRDEPIAAHADITGSDDVSEAVRLISVTGRAATGNICAGF